jgi:hypothetical protein
MREQTTISQLKKKQLSIPVAIKTTKVRPKVQCHCRKCNGKWTDSRTREKHFAEEEKLRLIMENPNKRKKKVHIQDSGPNSVIVEHQLVITESDNEFHSVVDNEKYNTNIESMYSRKKRKQSFDQFLDPVEVNQQPSDIKEKKQRFDRFLDPAKVVRQFSDEEEDDDLVLSDDDEALDVDDVLNKLFSAPNFDSNIETFNTNVNVNDMWILLWIFKYQSRFKLSDSAIDVLIQFFKLVLLDIDKNRFEKFPSSAYMAKKLMGFAEKSKNYIVCPNCNKLFNPTEIISTNLADSRIKCNHIEFPNHPMKNQRKSCNSDLLKKIPAVEGYILRPIMIYPLPCLKTQLIALYQQAGFEELLRKWTSRDISQGLMFDIYDGDVWKTFPSQHDISDPSPFFTPETADSHLGIMINLDWFQPFNSKTYSCGVIYGVICNLPRDIRFKKEYMLTLGLLPGPTEVKLHHINHYLAPIVDVLLEFWYGFDLPVSSKHPIGKRIRLAVICCSSDIPAARKLCGHISALVACHRCYKHAKSNGNNQRANFGGFNDIDEWFKERDLNEHRYNAKNWLGCISNEERKQHVSNTHVRWSELLRLPYFNPIRYLVVDPMHCLFLGIARWIVKRLWIENGKLTKSDLELIEKRAKKIKIPTDLGRVPDNIATGEGFSQFTADQWRSFMMIYATPILWDLLDESDRKILANFVRACFLLVSRIIDKKILNEAHNRLLSVAKLIEEHYGPEFITPNIHLSLHLTECCQDYGPLYSFWCFSFERMNGILGKFSN